MDQQAIIDHCLSLPGAWLNEPWDGDVVAKVDAKIFCFVGDGVLVARGASVGVKCGPRDVADEWLDRYPDDASVMPYLGRHGWNTLQTGGTIPDDEVREAIEESYHLVVATLPKAKRP